jgi:hypothetical protein
MGQEQERAWGTGMRVGNHGHAVGIWHVCRHPAQGPACVWVWASSEGVSVGVGIQRGGEHGRGHPARRWAWAWASNNGEGARGKAWGCV